MRGEPSRSADHAKAPARRFGGFDLRRGLGARTRGGGPLPGDGPDRHAAQPTRRAQRPNRRDAEQSLLVAVVDTRDDANGRPWAFVVRANDGRPLGWVFREFIACF
jgi:hypothetical protein